MSRPSVAGFLLSPPGTAEAEEAGARGKRVPRRSPLGFLPRFFQFFVPRSGRRPNIHGTRGRCQAPSAFPPKGCGGPAARAPSGALCADARFDRPSRASALASLSPSRAGGRGARRQRVLATPGADSHVTSCPLTASAPWQLETVRGSVLLRPRAQVTAEATASGDMSVREKFLRDGAERWGGAPASGTGVAWAA